MRRIIGDVQELASAVGHITRSEADEIRRQAEQRAEGIRRAAGERAAEARTRVLEEAESEADRIRRRREAQTFRTHQQEYLRERERLLEEVWRRAEERLRSLRESPDGYVEALRRLAFAAARILGPGEVTLSSDPVGHELLTADRLEQWSLEFQQKSGMEAAFQRSPAPIESSGGLIAGRGESRIDATFATRLVLAREEIRAEVFEQMSPA